MDEGEGNQPTASGGLSPVVTLELAEADGGSPQQAPTLLASSLLSFRLCRWLPRLCTLEPGRLIRSTSDPSVPRGRREASQQRALFVAFYFCVSPDPITLLPSLTFLPGSLQAQDAYWSEVKSPELKCLSFVFFSATMELGPNPRASLSSADFQQLD